MGSRKRELLCLCVLASIGLTGCARISGIRGVPIDTAQPLMLTADEARTIGDEAWAAYGEQPRTVARVTAAAQRLERSARALPDDYVSQVRAAEALAFVAGYDTRRDLREQAAKAGIVLARRAVELDPDRAAGHYWYAMNVGFLADIDRSYGLDAVSEMDQALRRAIELDEGYDHAGPLRLLAILHLRTPAPPVAIGSNRKALRRLRRAIELFPDFPENFLYLAEAEYAVGQQESARASLKRVLDSTPVEGLVFETGQWQQLARQLEIAWKTDR